MLYDIDRLMMIIVYCNELKETYDVTYSRQDDIHDLPEADMAIMRRAAALVTKYMVVDVVMSCLGEQLLNL